MVRMPWACRPGRIHEDVVEILLYAIDDLLIVASLYSFDTFDLAVFVRLHPAQCEPACIGRQLVHDAEILRTQRVDDVVLQQPDNGFKVERSWRHALPLTALHRAMAGRHP